MQISSLGFSSTTSTRHGAMFHDQLSMGPPHNLNICACPASIWNRKLREIIYALGSAHEKRDVWFEVVPQSCYSTRSVEPIDLGRPKCFFMCLIKSNVVPLMCLIHTLGSAHDRLDVWSRPFFQRKPWRFYTQVLWSPTFDTAARFGVVVVQWNLT